MSKFVLLFTFIVCCSIANAQNTFKRNEIFLELMGNGLLGSINYERQFGEKPGLGFRAGLGIYGQQPGFTVPVGLNYLINITKNSLFLDLGVGATYASNSDGTLYISVKRQFPYTPKTEFLYVMPSLGLKIVTSANYVWRTNIGAIRTDVGIFPYLGFGFGKRF